MTSILVLGFLLGMRHALEADHLAAIASLVTGDRSLRRAALRGALWGVGHTLTLLIVGGGCLLLDAGLAEPLARGAELLVGLMLLVLGLDVLRRMRRRKVHVHPHRHADGTRHVHAHSHAGEAGHDPDHHEHDHSPPRRALAIGLVHGLAGSAALLLLTLQTVGSVRLGLAYIGLFGLGSILGMAALSAAIAVPLGLSARLLQRVHRGLEGAVAVATLAAGAWVLVRAAGPWSLGG